MRRRLQPTSALYVRLPLDAAEKLQRAADARAIPKKEVIAELVQRHLGPAASTGAQEPLDVANRDNSAVGRYTFYEYPEPEVMTLEEAAAFLRVPAGQLADAVKSGRVPAQRIGEELRLSRRALLNWLSGSLEDPARDLREAGTSSAG